ncbi:MAG: UDP-2,3-diacylglucosamine diphosphatase [Candidatus Hydrogenedentales bacterium]
MTTLIFADVHLKATPDGEADSKAFTQFLRTINDGRYGRIIVLGDLFDFWFEYRHVIFSGYFDVLRAFAALHDNGVELHLVSGNHDFWAGRFLRNSIGFALHPESLVLKEGGMRVLFAHGDGLNPRDLGYRVYKNFARARPVISLFRLLHPDWAMALAMRVSHGSRALRTPDQPSDNQERPALHDFARRTVAEGGADVVICGHTHFPERESYPAPAGEGTYLNTGDWMNHRSYVEWRGHDFVHQYWNDAEQAPARINASDVLARA